MRVNPIGCNFVQRKLKNVEPNETNQSFRGASMAAVTSEVVKAAAETAGATVAGATATTIAAGAAIASIALANAAAMDEAFRDMPSHEQDRYIDYLCESQRMYM